MSQPQPSAVPGATAVPGRPPCAECGLAALVSRSQIDFEIDFFERILNRDPDYIDVLCNLGELFAIKGWPRRALGVDLRLANLRPEDPIILYNVACSFAMLNRSVEALAALERAVACGFTDVEQLLEDPDLEQLHGTPVFERIVAELSGILPDA